MYQQLYLHVIPMITNLGFINPFVVAVRIYWFRKKLKQMSMQPSCRQYR